MWMLISMSLGIASSIVAFIEKVWALHGLGFWLPFCHHSRMDCKVLKFTLVKHMLFAMRWQRVKLKIPQKKRVCCACIEKYAVSSITLMVNMSAHGACSWLKQCIWSRRNAWFCFPLKFYKLYKFMHSLMVLHTRWKAVESQAPKGVLTYIYIIYKPPFQRWA